MLVTMAWVADAGAQAVAYPVRPLRLIIPFPPGGSTDIYARILAPEMAKALGQQVVIDNRPGAGGALGAELAAKAPPDGYTIWIGQANNLAIGPAMRAKNAYDPVRDFTPIALIMKSPQVMVVNAGSPISSIKDLIAAAKSNPGKLTYGTAGIGSTGHLNGELFNQAAGVNTVHVPYKGASPAMLDLLGGRISYMATSTASATQFLKEGKIKAIATSGLKRTPTLPGVPTVAESGLPGYEVASFHGFLGPAKLPQGIVARLNQEIVSILRMPEVQKPMLAEGGELAPSTPEEFAVFLRSEVLKWAKVIKRAGITAE
jgi:tripartite-type tricarboxylate transporter receptor subunit TctC